MRAKQELQSATLGRRQKQGETHQQWWIMYQQSGGGLGGRGNEGEAAPPNTTTASQLLETHNRNYDSVMISRFLFLMKNHFENQRRP